MPGCAARGSGSTRSRRLRPFSRRGSRQPATRRHKLRFSAGRFNDQRPADAGEHGCRGRPALLLLAQSRSTGRTVCESGSWSRNRNYWPVSRPARMLGPWQPHYPIDRKERRSSRNRARPPLAHRPQRDRQTDASEMILAGRRARASKRLRENGCGRRFACPSATASRTPIAVITIGQVGGARAWWVRRGRGLGRSCDRPSPDRPRTAQRARSRSVRRRGAA